MTKLEEYEIREGKPHGGLWLGTYAISRHIQKCEDIDPVYLMTRQNVENWEKSTYPEFEHRHVKLIEKPPLYAEPLNSVTTVGIKFLAWGRAFKILKIKKTGKITYKRRRMSGRIKWVKNRRKK